MKKLFEIMMAIIGLALSSGLAQATTAQCWVRTDSPNTLVYDGPENVYQPLANAFLGPSGTTLYSKQGVVSNVSGTPTEESDAQITRTIHVEFNPPLNSTERQKLYFEMSVIASPGVAVSELTELLNRTKKITSTTSQLSGNYCVEADKIRYHIYPNGETMDLTAYYHQRQVSRSDCQELAWDHGANRVTFYFQRNPVIGGQTEPGFACSVMVDQPEFVP